MNLEIKTKLRPVAREKADWYVGELNKAATTQKNIHQASIDLMDQVEVFATSLQKEERVVFMALFTEELNARAAEQNDRTISSAANMQVGFTIFGVAIVVIVFAVLFAMR